MSKCVSCLREATGRLVPKKTAPTPTEREFAFCAHCAKQKLFNPGVFEYREGFVQEPEPMTYVAEIGSWPDLEIIYAGPSLQKATERVQQSMADEPKPTNPMPASLMIWKKGQHLVSLEWNGEKWEEPERDYETDQ